MAFDQVVGKTVESSQWPGTETGLVKELEMGFIRHHIAEQASSELDRAGSGWAVRE